MYSLKKFAFNAELVVFLGKDYKVGKIPQNGMFDRNE